MAIINDPAILLLDEPYAALDILSVKMIQEIIINFSKLLQIQKKTSDILDPDLNFFSSFIKDFSKDMPFFYGLFSILFAVSLGIGAAFIRRSISNFRKKYFNKSLKQTK